MYNERFKICNLIIFYLSIVEINYNVYKGWCYFKVISDYWLENCCFSVLWG